MTAVKYTMTPEEQARWSANPFPSINLRNSTVLPLEDFGPPAPTQRLGDCGHPVFGAGATLCIDCYRAQKRTKTYYGECGHPVSSAWTKQCKACRAEDAAKRRKADEARRNAYKARPLEAPVVRSAVSSLEEIIDAAWDERPHLTREAVARLVRKELSIRKNPNNQRACTAANMAEMPS